VIIGGDELSSHGFNKPMIGFFISATRSCILFCE
jgi:hypothetical protein